MSIGTLERILTLFFNMYTVGEERFGEAILRTHEIRIRHHRTQDLCFCGLLGVVVGWVNSATGDACCGFRFGGDEGHSLGSDY
jgi:hypothetical protein